MEEKEIKRLFRQAGDSIQAIFDYFRMKNKVLWTGTWSSGAITVADIGKYDTVEVYFWNENINPVLCKVMETKIAGGGFVTGVTSSDVQSSVAVQLARSGTKLTKQVGGNQTMGIHHVSTGSHIKYNVNIVKIVGIEPILPNSLQQIITTPPLNRIFKRWCMA